MARIRTRPAAPAAPAPQSAPEGQAEVAAPAAPIASHGSHTHFCEVCKTVVAHCNGEPGDGCQHPGPQYCSAHVPVEHHTDKDHPYFGARVEEKPVVRMTVNVSPKGE